jgi:NADH-quinone oxidoreductase subunit J
VDTVLFYVFGGIAVVASFFVIAQRHPMYSVLLLIASFIGLAGLYVLLDSPFAAVTQIIIYAGAIMVLFLFVVMLLDTPREDALVRTTIPFSVAGRPLRVGAVLGVLFLAEIVWALRRVPQRLLDEGPDVAASVQSVSRIGVELFTTYTLAFEATSLLILVAMVGAVVLAKRNL